MNPIVPQIKENKWSCLPVAFAMAAEMPVFDLIVRLDHDGSEIMFDDEKIPQRGFHPQEIKFALYQDHYVTEFYTPTYGQDHNTKFAGEYKDALSVTLNPVAIDKFRILRHHAHCVYAYYDRNGRGHAVAWDAVRGVFIDPDNGDYLDSIEYEPNVFWCVEKREVKCAQLFTGQLQDQLLQSSQRQRLLNKLRSCWSK